MDREVLRLELVKLTFKAGLQDAAGIAITQAKTLENFIAETDEKAAVSKVAEPTAQKVVKTKGKADTSNPFG